MAKAVVRGDREIIQNMRRAYNSVGGRTLDGIMSESLEPLETATEQNARRLRQIGYNPPGGHLDQGVVIAKREAKGALFRVYWVSFRKRARRIAHLVEFGTAPHWQPLRRIMHPGARPKPFFRPAFESTKRIVVDTVALRTWNVIRNAILKGRPK